MPTLPVTIPLPAPVKDAERTLDALTIGRRRNGADLRAEAQAENADAMLLVQIERLCGLMPGTVNRLPMRVVNRVGREIASLSEDPPDIDAWPYTLRHPLPGLTQVQQPREAVGADSRQVGKVAGDRTMLRMLTWVELLCGLTPAQIDAMDAVDAEALCLGVVPFYSDSPTRPSAGDSSPASP